MTVWSYTAAQRQSVDLLPGWCAAERKNGARTLLKNKLSRQTMLLMQNACNCYRCRVALTQRPWALPSVTPALANTLPLI